MLFKWRGWLKAWMLLGAVNFSLKSFADESLCDSREFKITLQKLLAFSQRRAARAKILAVNARKPVSELLEKVRVGEPLHYIMGANGEVQFVIDEVMHLPNSRGLLIAAAKGEDGVVEHSLIKEAGQIVFDEENQVYIYRKNYSSPEPLPGELDSIRERLHLNPLAKVARESLDKDVVLECSQIMKNQKQGKSFVSDQVASALGVTTLSIWFYDRDRFVNPEKRGLLCADYLVTFVNTFYKSVGNKKIVLSEMSLLRQFVERLKVSGQSMGLQAPLFYACIKAFETAELEADKVLAPTKGASPKISAERRAQLVIEASSLWIVPSVAEKITSDWFVLNMLPDLAYNFCLKNPLSRFVVNPRVFRLGESFVLSRYGYQPFRDWYLKKREEWTSPAPSAPAAGAPVSEAKP